MGRACSSQGQGSPLWACCQGQGTQPKPRQALIGMLPRLGHIAAKAKVAPMGRQLRPRHTRVHAAKAKAMATLMGKQSMPRHVAKATTCLCGHASLPLGAGSKAFGGM